MVSNLRRSIPELNGAMVASVDGLSVAHDFPEPDAERMAAMAATALGLGKRIWNGPASGRCKRRWYAVTTATWWCTRRASKLC